MSNRAILGNEYKDQVSGFVGIAICETNWLNGCSRVTLQPKTDKDGKLPKCETFDVEQLAETGGDGYTNDPTPKGGDRDDAQAISR